MTPKNKNPLRIPKRTRPIRYPRTDAEVRPLAASPRSAHFPAVHCPLAPCTDTLYSAGHVVSILPKAFLWRGIKTLVCFTQRRSNSPASHSISMTGGLASPNLNDYRWQDSDASNPQPLGIGFFVVAVAQG